MSYHYNGGTQNHKNHGGCDHMHQNLQTDRRPDARRRKGSGWAVGALCGQGPLMEPPLAPRAVTAPPGLPPSPPTLTAAAPLSAFAAPSPSTPAPGGASASSLILITDSALCAAFLPQIVGKDHSPQKPARNSPRAASESPGSSPILRCVFTDSRLPSLKPSKKKLRLVVPRPWRSSLSECSKTSI